MKNIYLFAALLLLCAGCGGADNAPQGETPPPPPPPAKFTLTFDLSGGSGSFAPVTVDSGEVAAAPDGAPAKPQHCFLGWFADSAATAIFSFGDPVAKNATAYAGWRARHTVTLHNVGDAPQPLYVCDGDSLILAMPQKPDVSFVDWYADSAFTVRFGEVGILRRDTALYARWINALRIEVKRDRDFCLALQKPFTFFAAYEDEEGTYTNQIVYKERPLYGYQLDDSIYNGNSYHGGEADAACRSKGVGWYLPTECEFINMPLFNAQPPFHPFSVGSTYWTSSPQSSLDAIACEYNEVHWTLGCVERKTNRYKVRCVWRPQ
jgi:uncharacterized repeat protein (TIGR02543 family)